MGIHDKISKLSKPQLVQVIADLLRFYGHIRNINEAVNQEHYDTELDKQKLREGSECYITNSPQKIIEITITDMDLQYMAYKSNEVERILAAHEIDLFDSTIDFEVKEVKNDNTD